MIWEGNRWRLSLMVGVSQSTIAFTCELNTVEIVTSTGSQTIGVEIADTTKKRAQGCRAVKRSMTEPGCCFCTTDLTVRASG